MKAAHQNRWRIWAALVVLGISCGLLAVISWPPRVERQVIELQPIRVPLSENGGTLAVLQDAGEARRAVLEWTPVMRTGEESRLTLSLEPTEPPQGSEPLLYDRYTVLAEARLEMTGLAVSPQGEIVEPMPAGRALRFFWKLHPAEPGSFNATLWLQIRLIPRGGGKEEEVAMLARPISFQAADLFGLPVSTLRLAGLIGAACGAVLAFPVLEGLFYRFWRRIRGRNDE